MKPVGIIACAPVSPIGVGQEEFAGALLADHRGIAWSDRFNHEVGEVRGFDLSQYLSTVKTYIDRTSALALAAMSLLPTRKVALSLGTQWGCMESLETFAGKVLSGNPKFAPPLVFTHSYANAPNSLIAIEFGSREFNICLSCGSTSGLVALIYAAQQLELGRCELIAAGGVDSLSRPIFEQESGRTVPLGEGAVLALLGTEAAEVELLDSYTGSPGAGFLDVVGQLDKSTLFIYSSTGLQEVDDMVQRELGSRIALDLTPRMGFTLGASGMMGVSAAVALLRQRKAKTIGVVSADERRMAAVLLGM